MVSRIRHGLAAFVGCAVLLCLGAPASLAQDEEAPNGLAEHFGFLPIELFKLEQRSSNMLAGDFNHDGLNDLVLVDNSNSRIDLLLQRPQKPMAPAALPPVKINEFRNDWRFEHVKVPVDKAISALTTGDFNGDGRADLAYLGQPDRLVIRYQTEAGQWKSDLNFRIPDPQGGTWTISAGDLNHDGKDDLAVLGKNETFLLYQKDGQLQTPERIMNTSDKLGLLHVGDLDGDGRADLCYLATDDSGKALCARLQSATGRIGAELRFDLEKPRGTTLKDIDGKPGLEILTIQGQTGRLKALQVRRPVAQAGELAGQLVQYGFGGTGARDRDLAVGDLTGDGLDDVLVTDPEGAQMILYQQLPGLGLDQGETFPGLFGANQVRIVDLNGDNQNEVVVLSTREKTIGVSRMENGRLTFPQPLPLSKEMANELMANRREPVLLAIVDLDGNQLPEVAFVARERTPSKTTYTLRAARLVGTNNTDWEWEPYQFGMAAEIPLALKADPEALIPFDANGDQRMDLLAFQGTDRPVLFLKANEMGGFTETTGEGGIGLTNLGAANVFVQPGAAPGLLVAQHNFARRLQLNERNQWRVVDQFSVSESKTNVGGVAALNLDGQPGDEIVLVDQGTQRLRVLRSDAEQVFRPWREVELAGFPFRRTHVGDFNGDGLTDLLLFGANRFGILYANQTDPKVNELATFETAMPDAFLVDVAAGDLNHDNRIDLALIEIRKHRIEILDYSAELGFRHALSFTVFEDKSFADGENSAVEPREAVISDVTGDGRADLILLTHDRVLLYPQDPGGAADAAATK